MKNEINLDSLVDYLISTDDEIDCLRQIIEQKEKLIEEIRKEIIRLNNHKHSEQNLQIFYFNIERLVK